MDQVDSNTMINSTSICLMARHVFTSNLCKQQILLLNRFFGKQIYNLRFLENLFINCIN